MLVCSAGGFDVFLLGSGIEGMSFLAFVRGIGTGLEEARYE